MRKLLLCLALALLPLAANAQTTSGAQPVQGTGDVNRGSPVNVRNVKCTSGTCTEVSTQATDGIVTISRPDRLITANVLTSTDGWAPMAGLATYSQNVMLTSAGTQAQVRGEVATGLHVVTKGGVSMTTGQVAVSTSSTLVAAARTGRQKITLTPTSSVVYYIGNTGVTTATGLYVAAGSSITLETAAAIYAVGAGAVTISYVELY